MQHINFFSQLERAVEPAFSARQQAQLMACILVVVIVSYVTLLIQQASWGGDLKDVQSQHSALNSELEALNNKKKAEENNPELKAELAYLEASVKFRRQLIASIDPNAQQESNGFAEHLNGLARQQVPGLWFTEVNLSKRGEHMALYGYTQKPEFVPQYLQKLSAEDVFAGKQFNVLRMSQAEKKQKAMRFEVKTGEVEASDE